MKASPPNQFRLHSEDAVRLHIPPQYGSTDDFGNNGMFFIPCGKELLRCVISDGAGWDHVSVSLKHRTPTWDEMCFIKDMFFEAEEVAMQLHPKKSEYVNHMPFCLHLWSPRWDNIPTPPKNFVGPSK
jgi:hypothetical protein